ncbi:MAG: DUF5688 family protein [Blautia sp.]
MREEILRELVEEVMQVAGKEYEVRSNLVKKNNDVELRAIIVRMPDEVISPTIYVDKYLEGIDNGLMTAEEAAKEVFSVYEDSKNQILGIDISKMMTKEYILNHVEYQMVNAERNAERIQIVPNKKIADLAALYRTVVSNDENRTASYIVTNEAMVNAGINIKELDEAAERNTEKSGFVIETIAEMMGIPEISEVPQMFVLSNARKTNGANIILYKKELAKLAQRIGGDFFILPSSIHELLAIPVSQAETEQLRQMVKEVNDTEVAPDEILGYEVYRYNSETGEVEIT